MTEEKKAQVGTPPLEAESRSPFLSRRDGAAELYLIRHADAVPTLQEMAAGIPENYDDQPLSAKGQKQAQALFERIKTIPFATLYASPLLRTQQTAAPLAEALGLPIQIEPDLHEVILPGPATPVHLIPNLNEAMRVMRNHLSYLSRTAMTTGSWDTVPGAENGEAFRQRVVTAIDSIASRHPGEQVAVFAHGGVINTYVANVLNLNRFYFYPIYNAGINIVRVKKDGDNVSRLLVTLNDAAHLQAVPGLLTER